MVGNHGVTAGAMRFPDLSRSEARELARQQGVGGCGDGPPCRSRVLRLSDGKPLYTTPPGVVGLGDTWVATKERVNGTADRAAYRVYTR